MPKKIMQDIKENKKTIHQIDSRDSMNFSNKIENHIDVVDTLYQDSMAKEHSSKHKHVIKDINTDKIKDKRNNNFIIYLFIIVVILSAIYFIANYFTFAKVVIYNKEKSVPLSGVSFDANRSGSDSVNFEVMILSDEIEKEITLKESQNVSNKATGVVTLYNEYSKTPVKLATGTLIKDKTGKTYKLDKQVSIPGYKIDKNKIIAGSIDITITAVLSGEAYNNKETDFFITSFASTPKYTKIYAKLKSEIKGGRSGVVYSLSAEDKGKVASLSESVIKGQLLKKLQAQIPDGYIFYPNTISFTSSFDEDALYDNKDARVKITTHMSAPIFNKDSLSRAIIISLFPNIKDRELKEIVIVNLPKINLTLKTQDQKITKDTQNLSVFIDSDIDLVWYPDLINTKTSLLGVHRKDFNNVFKLDPGIENADVKIFPFWESYMPISPQRVNLELFKVDSKM